MARRRLKTLLQWLERNGESGAAASLREGLEETLAVTKLGLPPALRTFLVTTNAIENLMGSTRRASRNVTRWRGCISSPRSDSSVLTGLRRSHIQRLIDCKTTDGLAAQSVVHIRNLLRLVLNRAVRWNLIARNPALLVDVPQIWRAPVDYLRPKDARRLLDAVKAERLEALYTAALSLGLRRGEALGLKWQDLDLEAGRLTVRRALQRLRSGLQLVEPNPQRPTAPSCCRSSQSGRFASAAASSSKSALRPDRTGAIQGLCSPIAMARPSIR